MVTVRARIRLFHTKDSRQTAFRSGYRPLFDFIPTMKTSGHITLKDRTEFQPGEEGVVEIAFGHPHYLGELGVGTRFTFGEGSALVGDGEVQAIL